jgi:hypothetical protein
MRTARAKLEDAYGAAVKKYTMDGKIALAKAVQKEFDEFKAGSSRPADAVKFGGKFYKVYDTNLTWHEAKKKCEQVGGRLAVIDSAEENEFVVGLVKKSKVVEVWLGATDEKKEGEWVWVTGKRMTYRNWERTQPNNKPPGEHYLMLVLGQDGRWSDQPDKSVQHKPGFVCQWD